MSLTTNELAPIATLSAMWTSPIIDVLAPIKTLSPIVAEAVEPEVEPMVTP